MSIENKIEKYLNESDYAVSVRVTNMVPGTTYIATYRNGGRTNSEEVKFLGFADDSDAKTPKWKTFKEAKTATTGEDLYMTGDYEGDLGSYYYWSRGGFARGSGADRVFFKKK